MDLTQKEVGVNGDGQYRYRFSFIPNGTAAPTLVGGKYVKSIVRNATLGAGSTPVYLVTFNSNFGGLLGFKWGVREVTGAALETLGIQLDPTNTNLSAAGGSVVSLRLCTISTGVTADFTAVTAGAQVDIEVCFATDPNNLV